MRKPCTIVNTDPAFANSPPTEVDLECMWEWRKFVDLSQNGNRT